MNKGNNWVHIDGFLKCLREIYMCHDKSEDLIDAALRDLTYGYLTINKCRSGRDALCYLDSSREECYYLDNCERLDEEEIRKELDD